MNRFCLFLVIFSSVFLRATVIVLNPAGNNNVAGRSIFDHFERGLTLQYAYAVQKKLQESLPLCNVVVNRFMCEKVDWLLSIEAINSISPDLVIFLHFYENSLGYSSLLVYTPLTHDYYSLGNSPLSFIPYDQAYKLQKDESLGYVHRVCNYLKKSEYISGFELYGPYSFPYKMMCAVMAPTFCVEIGLQQENDWNLFVDPLAKAIISSVKK